LPSQAQDANLLEEIVVTARMRAENIQEVPVTISAFTAEDIDQLGELFFMPANWVARDELDLINLRGGFNFGSDQSLQLAIWCDNCTDENYFGEGFNDAGGLFYYGRLRQTGVELTKRF